MTTVFQNSAENSSLIKLLMRTELCSRFILRHVSVTYCVTSFYNLSSTNCLLYRNTTVHF